MTTLFGRQISKLATGLCAAAGLIATSPATAESAALPATSANVEAVGSTGDDTAQSVTLLTGDETFREAFAEWTSLDFVPDAAVEFGQPAHRPTIASVPSIKPVSDYRMTSRFGMRNHPVRGGRRMHKGVDLAAPTGTPVYATADGVVELSKWGRGYGNYIAIDHGSSMETRYAHLSRSAVSAGDRVKRGDLIGYVGSTGWSTGPHLHYEVRIDGVAVNPIPYMEESREQMRLVSAQPVQQETTLPGRRRVGIASSEVSAE